MNKLKSISFQQYDQTVIVRICPKKIAWRIYSTHAILPLTNQSRETWERMVNELKPGALYDGSEAWLNHWNIIEIQSYYR